jgi:hypothetical protein
MNRLKINHWMLAWALGLVVVTVAVTTCILSYQWREYGRQEYQLGYNAGQMDTESEYYRGVFDACMQAAKQVEVCKAVVFVMYKNGWYEKSSTGYETPVISDPKLKSG